MSDLLDIESNGLREKLVRARGRLEGLEAAKKIIDDKGLAEGMWIVKDLIGVEKQTIEDLCHSAQVATPNCKKPEPIGVVICS